MKIIIRHTLPMKLAMLLVVMFGGWIISGNNLRAQSTIGFNSVGFYGLPDTVANHDHHLVGTFVEIQSLLDSLNNDSIQLRGYIDTLGPSVIPFASPFAQ